MKRIFSLVLVLGLMLTLCSCGNDKGRKLYNVNLNKYVELGDYKNLKIDTNSDEYKENYESVLQQHIEANNFYKGTVKDGDVVNIDFVGKIDGVAFEGGTSYGYDLEIGSGNFIGGFEEGLIGVNVGETVDLNLRFPDKYENNEELAGKDVVFTVKVNYTDEKIQKTPEEYYKDLDFDSVEDYYADVKQTAIKWTMLNAAVDGAQVKDYPQEDLDYLKESSLKTIESNVQSSYGIDLDTYLEYAGQERADFESSIIEEQIKPMMKSQMAIYAIFDNEGLSFTQKEVDDQVNKIVTEINDESIDAQAVKDYYGEYYFEDLVIDEKVTEFLLENATIS